MNKAKKLEWMLDWLLENHNTTFTGRLLCPYVCVGFSGSKVCPRAISHPNNKELYAGKTENEIFKMFYSSSYSSWYYNEDPAEYDNIPCRARNEKECWRAAAEWAYEHCKEK